MNANCSVLLAYSSSIPLKLSMSYSLLFSCIGFPIFTWASVKLWTGVYTKSFHRNFRLIVQMHLFGFMLHCSGRIVLHTLDLFNYTFLQPCDMIPNIYRCFIFRLMYNLGFWITHCTAVPLIIERYIATRLMGKYENKFIWLGILLACMQPCLAAVPLYFAYMNLRFDGVFMPYCSVYKPGSPTIANINSGVAICAQVVARILFGFLFTVNKNRRVRMQTSPLSTRFQLEENKMTMQCLSIYANFSSLFLFVQIFSFIYLLSISPEMPKEHYLAWMEFNAQFPLYGIVSVVLVARKISSLRSSINTNLNQQVHLNETKTYFDMFNKQIGKIGKTQKKKK
ncbi:CRE-SRAB-26 protein [Caenorhabditis remanei]|uniref:CRE-SRAB-26 protein n=1 Tax=Caenorhabditis remanei TaxID=31234 RepID=E3MHJ3_CAERE|nr:CRE-SRAB-26 protein [Caenorhabditis remanei]